MPSTVFVKVVGFRDVERHALNTVFRLSLDRPLIYALWIPDMSPPANLALIDVDSYEGGLEIASPTFNTNLKLICVGEKAPAHAWRVFPRPMSWMDVVKAMDELFMASAASAPSFDPDATVVDFVLDRVPAGVKVSMVVDESREHGLYLRARLALAGLTEVDEMTDGAAALQQAARRRYDLVVVNLDSPNVDGWKLVAQLVALEPAIGSVVVSSRNNSWALQQQAEQAGCSGVLEVPFDPSQIVQLLQKI
jgi:CheY-like chemotaxis protein